MPASTVVEASSTDPLYIIINVLLGLVFLLVAWYVKQQTNQMTGMVEGLGNTVNKQELSALRSEMHEMRDACDRKIEKLRDKEVHELFEMLREQQESTHKDMNELAATLRKEMKEAAENTTKSVGAQIANMTTIITTALKKS